MKRLISLLVCCFIVVLFSGCAQLIIAELEDRANEKGRQNIKTWATNHIPIGANEDEVLQRFGYPHKKESDFWIYPVPADVTKIPKGSNVLVAIFFSDNKVISWLVYSYWTGSVFLEVRSKPSYSYKNKNITLGMSKEAIIEQCEFAFKGKQDELAYKKKDIWLFWESPKIKYSFFRDTQGTENTMAALIFQQEKVAVIFCFRGYEYYGERLAVSPDIIITPDK